jgi:predicted MFS family arabinose efflux permease
LAQHLEVARESQLSLVLAGESGVVCRDGVVVDRVEKRNLLITTQAFTGMVTLVIAVLITTDAIELWHLVIASLASGVILAFNLPGRQAIIPELVERRQIMNAVGLGSGAMNLSRIVAPALAGVLVGVIGIAGVYYIMVACYALAVAMLFMIPPLGVPAQNNLTTPTSALREGLSYVRRSSILMALLTMAFVPIVFGMPYQMLMPVFAVDVLHVGPSGFGYLMAATGVGALVGSLVVASLGDFRHKGLFLLSSSALFGVFLILFASSRYFYLSLFLLLGVGAASAGYLASNNTLLQLNVDDNVRGRVMSMYMMTIGLFPIGVMPAAALAEAMGIPFAVGLGGGILLLFTLAMALLRPGLRKL